MPHQIVKIRVTSMWETCNRTTFYVELTTDEGFTMTPAGHATGSIYTEGKGLSIEEARERALIDADVWADFLGLEVEPYVENDMVIEPQFTLNTYRNQRALADRRTKKG